MWKSVPGCWSRVRKGLSVVSICAALRDAMRCVASKSRPNRCDLPRLATHRIASRSATHMETTLKA